MRVGLAASEGAEKGRKATHHTHILVTKTPLLSPAAFVWERSDIHTTVTASVVINTQFQLTVIWRNLSLLREPTRILHLELLLLGCCKKKQSHFFPLLLASSMPQSPTTVCGHLWSAIKGLAGTYCLSLFHSLPGLQRWVWPASLSQTRVSMTLWKPSDIC